MPLTMDPRVFSDELSSAPVGWIGATGQLLTSVVRASIPAVLISSLISSQLRIVGWEGHSERLRTSDLAIISMTGEGNVTLIAPNLDPMRLVLQRLGENAPLGASFSLGTMTTLPAAQIVEAAPNINQSIIQPPHLEAIRWMKSATGLSQERIAELLGVSRQTLNRWSRGEPIKDGNRRRIFGVRQILELAYAKRPTREQMLAWLDTPQLADAVTPAQALAAGKLDRARLLAVTTPSPHVKLPPAWVRRHIPEAFRAGAEQLQIAMPPDDDTLDIDFQE